MCFKVNGHRISLHNENDIAVSMQKYSYTSLYSYSYIATEPIQSEVLKPVSVTFLNYSAEILSHDIFF